MQITNYAFEKGLSLAHSVWAEFRRYPKSPEKMLKSKLYNSFWYYDVELMPGIITKGQFPQAMPLLPRMLLRNCDLNDADCLDVGSMEGLLPVLMCRQGAKRVLATDFIFHCYMKMRALMTYYEVDFSFQRIGHLYDLSSKIHSRQWPGFDLINLSGVLYHVFSPFHVLAGLRPLLKKNGLMIVSTNVVDREEFAIEFNNSGRFQAEVNTFWYLTIPMFDYMLRYFQLAPVDCLYYKYPVQDKVRWVEGSNAGYLAVVCRAVEDKGAGFGDSWLSGSVAESWEYLLCNQRMMDGQRRSRISYQYEDGPIDLRERVNRTAPLEAAPTPQDTSLLRLADRI